MPFLTVFRVVAFSFISVFAAIVVAMGGYLTSLVSSIDNGLVVSFTFSNLAIATGALTILVVPTSLIIDMNRQGAWSSMIVFEVVVMSILWVLWVATAALSSQALVGASGCSSEFFVGVGLTICQVATAIEALSFLTWILILAYIFILLVFTFIATSRGHNVWLGTVKDTNFFAPSIVQPQAQFAPQQQHFVQTPMPVQPMYPNYQPGMPMQQMPGTPQQQYTPQGVPMQYTGTPV